MSQSTYYLPFRGSIEDLILHNNELLLAVSHPEGQNLGLYSFSVKNGAPEGNTLLNHPMPAPVARLSLLNGVAEEGGAQADFLFALDENGDVHQLEAETEGSTFTVSKLSIEGRASYIEALSEDKLLLILRSNEEAEEEVAVVGGGAVRRPGEGGRGPARPGRQADGGGGAR